MKALILAGGISQAELIKDLKSRGIYTILADRNPKAYAVPFADKFYPISTMDIEAVKKLAADEKVDFVITVCADQVLLVVAQLSEELGLPCYIDYHTAKLVSNKKYMKAIFKESGVPTADYVVMSELDEDKLKGFEFPLIVKPVDCYSSRGVRRVENMEELRSAFADAADFSRTGNVIVEDFCEGYEMSCDAYIDDNGIAHVLTYSINEKIKEKDKFVICRNKIIPDPSEKLKAQVRQVMQGIADGFHISNSPIFAQMINDGNKIRVLEFCARTGGCIKFRLAKLASGFDVVSAVVDLTLGKKPVVGEIKSEYKYIANTFLYCRKGVFDHMEGVEELLSSGKAYAIDQLAAPGTEFSGNVTCSGDRVGCYTVVGETEEEVIENNRAVMDVLKVIDVNGKDMLRHELIEELSFRSDYIDS